MTETVQLLGTAFELQKQCYKYCITDRGRTRLRNIFLAPETFFWVEIDSRIMSCVCDFYI